MKVPGEASQQQIAITSRNGKHCLKPIRQAVGGQMISDKSTEINNNNLFEITVYLQSESGSTFGRPLPDSVGQWRKLSSTR